MYLAAYAAGPVDFGQAELQSALAAKSLKFKIAAEIGLEPPESFQIDLYRVTGGDLRGLMYGLIEAADQFRATGRMKSTRATPAAKLRSIRMALTPADLDQPWASSEAFWREYFQMLARARINRFNLVIPRLQGQLFWLRRLPQLAAEDGVDFVFGLSTLPGSASELREALAGVLSAGPLIRGIELEAAGTEPMEVYRDGVYRALKEAGHRVTLDLRDAWERPELATAALEMKIPLRVSSNGACGAQAFCTAGAGYEFYRQFEAEALSDDAGAIRGHAAALAVDGSAGFEIDIPRAHLGGAAPDWTFEEFKSAYSLWGRLGYDPKYQFPAPPPGARK
jgi:hypothetical protein